MSSPVTICPPLGTRRIATVRAAMPEVKAKDLGGGEVRLRLRLRLRLRPRARVGVRQGLRARVAGCGCGVPGGALEVGHLLLQRVARRVARARVVVLALLRVRARVRVRVRVRGSGRVRP